MGLSGTWPLAIRCARRWRKAAAEACAAVGVVGKLGGTYVCMEGPQFSTKAESNLYRSWGADVIGMTNLQEAKLAREAEICYATVAMVTDYDCWREGHDAVTIEEIVAVLHQNADECMQGGEGGGGGHAHGSAPAPAPRLRSLPC